jgi:hypothetical protein
MPAGILEPDASTEGHPVFVDDGQRRNRAGRLATTTFGLMLAAWLAALAAGLIGPGPFPQLALFGTDHGHSVPEMRPQKAGDPPAARASHRVGLPSSSSGEAKLHPRTPAPIHSSTGASSTGNPATGNPAGGATGGDGTSGSTTGRSDTPTQTQPPAAATTQTPSADAPSPPPVESTEQSAETSGSGATSSPDVVSGTSPDGSGTPTSPVESDTTNCPDAPIDASVPTG